MKITVKWFRHHHENRNDLLRFGFMRLHYNAEIDYIERPLADAFEEGFHQAIGKYPDLRHLSFILIQNGKTKIRCIVDNEDSFALVSPLVTHSDFYFCAGYNTDFFQNYQFVNSYSWQKESDVIWYKNTIDKKIETLGQHFKKIKKFIPIAPNQGTQIAVSSLISKIQNINYRLRKITGKGIDFSNEYRGFEVREQALKKLRSHELKYDIVLNDSLWGWPKHRVNLHKKLQELANKNYKIHSILNWTDPVPYDGSLAEKMNAESFPMVTLPIQESYEEMLAQSRLAVFACGFHWGWRNIMMLALQAGIPVLTDRLLTEAYFNMNEFQFFQQEDHRWNTIEENLMSIDNERWEGIKRHNQFVYDKYMSPEVVARYVIQTTDS
ncbi:MAG: hypothetical protein EOO01_18220 [Chitinophagaceae bacterium]|nr:MAG: hypothetical protein EOO01_18220 [Chitinophagaceae bacterium]